MERNSLLVMLTILCLSVSTLSMQTALSQKKIKGKLDNYPGQQADVMVGMMEPMVIGSISANGSFEIKPPADYLEAMTSSMKNNKQGGFSISLRMVDDAFGNCDNSTVQIENGDQPLLNLTTQNTFMIGDLEAQEKYGYMAASNDRDFAIAVMSHQQGSASKGYVLDWFYFEEPATVKGECRIKSYTLTQKEEDLYERITAYDMDFKKGWNLVKYEYADIYTDSANKTYASKINYHTLEKMPEEVSFFYFKD